MSPATQLSAGPPETHFFQLGPASQKFYDTTFPTHLPTPTPTKKNNATSIEAYKGHLNAKYHREWL